MAFGDDRSKSEPGPHRLSLEDRQHLVLTGVTDVDSFDETTVLLQTNRGLVSVRGEGLQLKNLSVEGGQAAVDGTVNAIVYEGAGRQGGFLKRLLG